MCIRDGGGGVGIMMYEFGVMKWGEGGVGRPLRARCGGRWGDHFVRLAGGDDRNEFAGSAVNMGKLANISPIEGRYSQ